MHGTLRFLSRHVHGLLLLCPFLLAGCGEYEYIRNSYTVNKAVYPPSTATANSAPTAVLPEKLLPAVPLPTNQLWLEAGCYIDATALGSSPCTQQIIMDVLRLPHSPAGDIRECFNASLKMNIRFEIDSSLQVNGPPSRCTLLNRFADIRPATDSATLNIIITLSPYHLTRSTRLAIAASIIHELLHAYFFYRSAEAWGNPLKEQQLAADFPLLKSFQLYKRYVPGNHHEQMAQRYIDKMARALREFQLVSEQSLLPLQPYARRLELDDYYKAIAWAGLAGSIKGDITKAWTDFKAKHQKTAEAYEIIIAAEHNCTVLSATKNKCGQ